MKSEQINELAAALAKAQSQLTGAKKDSTNPFFKSRYADLESCWEALRDPLSKNGLAVVQTAAHHEGHHYLETTLVHSSGQWISGLYPIKTQKDDAQGFGAAFSYARRYSLAAITGLFQQDDDAETSMNRQPPQAKSFSAVSQNKAPYQRGQS
jgi:hypothetical protein